MIESLETRTLLAATAALVKGVLTITGTADADTIDVSPKTGGKLVVRVTPSDLVKSFTASGVKHILINAGAGGDIVSIDSAILIPATINGEAGNDVLSGGGGDDVFDGGPGADQFDGDGGHDTVTYASRTKPITVNLDNTATSGEANEKDRIPDTIQTIIGGSGNDNIDGSASNANLLLIGNAGRDAIRGGGGNDTLQGGAGNDTLYSSGGADVFTGGAGSDTVTYASNSDDLNISLDNVANDGGVNELDNVDDTNETIVGGSGDDVISVSNSAKITRVLFGGAGNDSLVGGVANDRLSGDDGNDTLVGGAGNDLLIGGAGSDVFSGGKGGGDAVTYGYATAPLTVSIDNIANDGVAGEQDNVKTDVENIYGGSGSDTLTGSSADNVIYGGAGNDLITGLGGKDSLFGESGNDRFVAKDGLVDAIDGGAGTDKLVSSDKIDLLTSIP